MTRRIAAAVALLAAVAASAAGTARADGGGATPSNPALAAALAGAPAAVASGSSTQLVPASSLPTPDAADAADAANAAVTPIWCWATALWHQWGTWPYEQRITDTTYWCALLDKSITSRSTTVTGTGTLCATNWTTNQLISGGIGYPWFTIQASAGFACPTVIPYITLHENRWVDVNRTDSGGTSEVSSG